MHGNAWEWCHDDWDAKSSDGSNTTVRNHEGRALRGGAFDSKPLDVRSANRGSVKPDIRYQHLQLSFCQNFAISDSVVTLSPYANELWTCPRVLEVIRKLFGVTYHVDYVGTLLHKLVWSVQKPEQRGRERDEAAIDRWQQQEWPRIKKGSPAKS